MFFVKEKRTEVKKGMTIGQIGMELSNLWRKLNDDEKRSYEELAKKDRVRYYQEMKKYNKRKLSQDDGTILVYRSEDEDEDD